MVTYTRTTWINDQVPAINDTNLNNIEAGIDALYNEFDANTILKADADNTPIKLAIAEQRILGRITAGVITGLTAAEVRTLCDVPTNAEAVLDTLFDAYSILYADTDDTPAALTIAASTFVGRKAAGGIAAMTVAEAQTLLNVADGADVTGSNPPQSHGADKHTDRTRYIWLGTPHYFTGGAEKYGIALDPDADELITYSFIVPMDFVSFSNLYVYYAGDVATNDVVLDITADYAATAEAQNVHSDSDTGNVITIADTNRQRFTTAGLLASIAANDVGVITVTRDANHASDTNTGDLVINGVLIAYTADM